MKKRLFAMWSVLLVLVVSIAVLVPGCTGGGGEGTINVNATLCGAPYPGAVGYTLTGPGSPIQGTSVPASHTVDAGSWGCGNVTAPAGTFLVDITPSANQTVSEGGNITYTLNFEENQDAWITFDTWTVDGKLVEECYAGECYAEVVPCQIIDVHFKQGVDGCDGYQVALNETSWLQITYTGGPPLAFVSVHVIDDWCALNKTPEPPHKYSQTTTIDGAPVTPETPPYLLGLQEVVTLDVETTWLLEKGVNYTKSINWLGLSQMELTPHPCVLFELLDSSPGQYTFTLVASAEVALVGAEDVNPDNDHAVSPPLSLTWVVPVP